MGSGINGFPNGLTNRGDRGKTESSQKSDRSITKAQMSDGACQLGLQLVYGVFEAAETMEGWEINRGRWGSSR
jgi:hypothetical protein